MFGFRYEKASPSNFTILSRNGRIIKQGAGQSFFYFQPSSTVSRIPISSRLLPFIFNETSSDYQPLVLQGQLTYRIKNPEAAAQVLDFSLDANGRYLSEDPDKLSERIVSLAQVPAKATLQGLELRSALAATNALADAMLRSLQNSPELKELGIEVNSLVILSIKTSKEMERALESATREALQKNADDAVYARRLAAGEQERLLKESELQTAIAVEEKKRQIRETQIAADIALELERSKLVEQKAKNDRLMADAQAYSLQAVMTPIKGMDWRTLATVSTGQQNPAQTIAMAFREMAENAAKIGEFNVSSDLLEKLLNK